MNSPTSWVGIALLTLNRKIAPRIAEFFRKMRTQTETVHLEYFTDADLCLEGEEAYDGNKDHDAGEFMDRLLTKLDMEEMEYPSMDKKEATKIHGLFKGKQEHSVGGHLQ